MTSPHFPRPIAGLLATIPLVGCMAAQSTGSSLSSDTQSGQPGLMVSAQNCKSGTFAF